MIGNLFDYEFKITAKSLLPLYIAAFAVSFLNKIISLSTNAGIEKFFHSSHEEKIEVLDYIILYFQIISYAVIGFIIIGIFISTYFVLIRRYYKSMYGSEGYLTNTLPIKSYQLILIKFLNFCVWLFVGSIVTFISILLILPDGFLVNLIWTTFMSATISLIYSFSLYTELFILMILNTLIYSCKDILIIFLAAAIANFSKSYKLLLGVASYFIIKTFLAIINYIAVKIPFAILFLNDNPESFSPELFTYSDIALGIIQCIAIFFITNHIHKNHLNLE